MKKLFFLVFLIILTFLNYSSSQSIDSEQNPVLLLPGIMGSYSSYLFNPEGGEYHWHPNIFINVYLTEEWDLDPITHTYQSFTDRFTKDGAYSLEYDFYPVGYDWRQRCDYYTGDSGLAELIKHIEEARLATGAEKVDLVCHSMGGLAARSYLEISDYYNDDVNKFVMLGTPNKGAVKNYYVWEAAAFREAYGWWMNKFFFAPFLLDMKIGWGYENESDLTFIQEMIPSDQQLLPTFDYIKDNATSAIIPVEEMYWQNNLILDPEALLEKLDFNDLCIYAGTGFNTLRGLLVDDYAFYDEDYWKDGHVIGSKLIKSGDSTVLLNSASLLDINMVVEPISHGDLLSGFKNEIYEFITGTNSEISDQEEEGSSSELFPPYEWFLFIGTRDKVQICLETPDGHKVGYMDGIWYKDMNHYIRFNEESTAALGLYDPTTGDYILQVKSYNDQIFTLYMILYNINRNMKHKLEISKTVSKELKSLYNIFIDKTFNLIIKN